MAIKSVTAESLTQLVNDRAEAAKPVEAEPAEEPKAEATAEAKAEAKPEVPAEPPKKRSVQERIDELTREKYEHEEGWRHEYELRVAAEKQLADMKSKPAPAATQLPTRPDRTKYKPEEADKYEDDLLKWNRQIAIAEFSREQAQRETQRRLTESATKARESLSDFDSVIARAPRDENPPAHIDYAIGESDYGAHLAYHLAKHPADKARLYALSAAKALLELGKIEAQYAAPKAAKEPAKETPTPTPARVPDPMPSLKAGVGDVKSDLSAMTGKDFTLYKQRRLEEERKRRARA